MSQLRLAAITWIGCFAFAFSTSVLQEQDKDSGAKQEETKPAQQATKVVDAAAKESVDQEIELPTASQVIEKYIFAVGGYEVLESIQSRHVVFKGTCSDGTQLESEYYQKKGQYYCQLRRDDFTYTRGVWSDGMVGKDGLRTGFAWQTNSGTTLFEKTGDELQEYLRRRSRVASSPYWETDFKSIKCVAQVKIRGISTWQLRFVDHDGKEIDRYFDTETGYCLRRKTMETFGGGTHEVVRDYMDHKELDGIVVPTNQTIAYRGIVDRLHTESVECDVEVPEHLLEIPDAIQRQIHALQRKQAAEKESAAKD